MYWPTCANLSWQKANQKLFCSHAPPAVLVRVQKHAGNAAFLTSWNIRSEDIDAQPCLWQVLWWALSHYWLNHKATIRHCWPLKQEALLNVNTLQGCLTQWNYLLEICALSPCTVVSRPMILVIFFVRPIGAAENSVKRIEKKSKEWVQAPC